jgi:aspartate aminotransferase
LIGKTIDGNLLSTNAQIADLLLSEAGVAVVPFQAFGLKEETGWMRMSVGAVSLDDISRGMPKIKALLERAQ